MKVNRLLRAALVLLMLTALLVPAAARFGPYHFRFSLSTAGTQLLPLEPTVMATGGFDVVHATTHLFHNGSGVPGLTRNDTRTRFIDIHREGWYAFLIRGGDGGIGNRSANNGRGSYGGSGGMVMGYVWLAADTRVYVHVAAAGLRSGATQTVRSAHGGGLGASSGGDGGGATILSTGSTPSHANAIAIAGGGGGGGGLNQVGQADAPGSQPNNRGGNAGATGAANNPILNGAVERTGTTVLANGSVVSAGFQGGNPANVTKTTARPGNTGSDGGGGGGSHNAGGQHGQTANPAAGVGAALLGGNGTAVAWGGGGGGGWFGGGGGFQHTGSGAWNGGGGGGSSFVRHDVRELTPEMMNSSYFAPFVALGGATDTTRYGGTGMVGDSVSGVIPLRNTNLYAAASNPGWQGFAVMMYLGPQDPAQWSHANTFNTWFNAAPAQVDQAVTGAWGPTLWSLINPITPWVAGNHVVDLPLYVHLYFPGGTWQRYYITNVTSLEREPNGDIIIWGAVRHPWSTNLTGENFTALRVTNGGGAVQRRQANGNWQPAGAGLSGPVTVIGHGP